MAADHLWLILCGALVMYMQAGSAMVESGYCRAKNVQNILLKDLTDVCVGTLGWMLLGCALDCLLTVHPVGSPVSVLVLE